MSSSVPMSVTCVSGTVLVVLLENFVLQKVRRGNELTPQCRLCRYNLAVGMEQVVVCVVYGRYDALADDIRVQNLVYQYIRLVCMRGRGRVKEDDRSNE